METGSQWTPEWIDLNEVDDAFHFEEGFFRPDWRAIRNAIHQKQGGLIDVNGAWIEAGRQWMLQLQSDLGGDYQVSESNRFFLVAPVDAEIRIKILNFAEKVLSQIREHLKNAAWNPKHGKHVILLFAEEDDYYQYISYFYPNGNHPRSGGCLIHKDYVHIAAPYDPLSLRQTLAHELTHNCVVHLRLPLWLNEGLAQTFQHAVATMPHSLLDHDLRERHLAFWNETTVQGFWAGTSFRKPGESNQLSYSLAEIVIKLLAERQGNWSAFVQQANRADAGQTAAIECLGTDLGDVMATFLGPGDWRPRRKAMVAHWEAQRKLAEPATDSE